jgi:hypothetical protein
MEEGLGACRHTDVLITIGMLGVLYIDQHSYCIGAKLYTLFGRLPLLWGGFCNWAFCVLHVQILRVILGVDSFFQLLEWYVFACLNSALILDVEPCF